MKKIKKLFKKPVRSANDLLIKRLPLSERSKESVTAKLASLERKRKLYSDKPTIYVIGFSTWKQYIRNYFKSYDLVFIDKNISQNHFNKRYRWDVLANRDCQFFIWGYKAPDFIFNFTKLHDIKTYLVEDGFIRSVGLGATKEPPLSLCLDSQAAYFDARRSTDLEDMLNTYNCTDDQIIRARQVITEIITNKISKYNHSDYVDVNTIYGVKKSKRILVIGQVEDDASIKYGCSTKVTNNDLVRLAVTENPDAQVLYKVHPDVMNGYRDYLTSPNTVRDICHVIDIDIPLADALETIDHVYTITSLSGIESLIRGIKVTTIGAPFYSGWGLTDDRQPVSRRNRNRTLEELVAISYLIYPKYFDSYSGETVQVEDVIKNIVISKEKLEIESQLINKLDNEICFPLGIYQHYRGGLYQLLHVARHSGEKEEMAVYRCLSGNCEVLISSISMFTEMVTIDGNRVLKLELIQAIEN